MESVNFLTTLVQFIIISFLIGMMFISCAIFIIFNILEEKPEKSDEYDYLDF